MQRPITRMLEKKTFGPSPGWFDSKTLSSVKASLWHRKAGEKEKESTRGTTGSAIAAGASAEKKGCMAFQILVRRCAHELPSWPLSYQPLVSYIIYQKNWRLANDSNRHKSLLRSWVAGTSRRLPRRVMVSVSTQMYGDSGRINITSSRNDLLGITIILSSDCYLRIQKTISTFSISRMKKTG